MDTTQINVHRSLSFGVNVRREVLLFMSNISYRSRLSDKQPTTSRN